jgi:hypothetical protein
MLADKKLVQPQVARLEPSTRKALIPRGRSSSYPLGYNAGSFRPLNTQLEIKVQ